MLKYLHKALEKIFCGTYYTWLFCWIKKLRKRETSYLCVDLKYNLKFFVNVSVIFWMQKSIQNKTQSNHQILVLFQDCL